jgi:parvulin-like peptidyl-prolyl isomerase
MEIEYVKKPNNSADAVPSQYADHIIRIEDKKHGEFTSHGEDTALAKL